LTFFGQLAKAEKKKEGNGYNKNESLM
jgi:hypothetical protein